MLDLKITTDAGETLHLRRSDLEYVEKTVYDRIKPSIFRTILRVDSSAPEWMEYVGYNKVVETAEWVPAQEYTEDFATASMRVEGDRYPLQELVSGYSFTKRELIRAVKTGMPLDTAIPMSIAKKGERILDSIAADGTLDGTKSFITSGGLYNHAGATVLGVTAGTTAIKGAALSWELAFAAVTTNDEYDAACEDLIGDLIHIEETSDSVTEQTAPIDTIVLPHSTRKLLRKMKTHNQKTLEEEFLDRAFSVTRLRYWDKPDKRDYGSAGATRRIVGLSAADEDIGKFALPMAPMPGAPWRTRNGGVYTPMGMVVGGFQSKAPQALFYADLDNAT